MLVDLVCCFLCGWCLRCGWIEVCYVFWVRCCFAGLGFGFGFVGVRFGVF